ncbi:MAG: hypothetical protein WA417_06925 [Stellaceae bacterium]
MPLVTVDQQHQASAGVVLRLAAGLCVRPKRLNPYAIHHCHDEMRDVVLRQPIPQIRREQERLPTANGTYVVIPTSSAPSDTITIHDDSQSIRQAASANFAPLFKWDSNPVNRARESDMLGHRTGGSPGQS